ncbi:hypothetical protein BKA82DRAFT_378524 [Pisolithus tinctorius]|uniref:Uncharacterized protein n=1 Tax=Pisolithus tinctorius Marx 270 TaxID=870435 RepID=A0A0C3PIQ5_PISTI|nr:hypothetical protein BKA82DRAFT_378524 [Pisolithus tinctorius]KIO07994.1 hypothetical protein M404DRAFT_378524 [Pisolithus tinctorius Marx 270]
MGPYSLYGLVGCIFHILFGLGNSPRPTAGFQICTGTRHGTSGMYRARGTHESFASTGHPVPNSFLPVLYLSSADGPCTDDDKSTYVRYTGGNSAAVYPRRTATKSCSKKKTKSGTAIHHYTFSVSLTPFHSTYTWLFQELRH